MKSILKRYMFWKWKMEDFGFSISSNTKGRERRQAKKRAKREYLNDIEKGQ